MNTISVDGALFMQELKAWRVPADYAFLFMQKCERKGSRVGLHPFFFNDTDHVTDPRHWLAVNAAFWCCAYREACAKEAQIEALAGIRALFYTAGALGVGEVKALIQEWWRQSFELHRIPAPCYSVAVSQPTFH
ncbi:hypothetical protein [Raoultella terrigena]|uniref:hypothetical protein n=1 Tax=Raoultella terrigena TaxID=577 RepID=UPI000F4B86E4|nr:hypothetical protein [Raoultella terrigena]ROR99706.1 hypothetical protein EDF76_3055 [Raoultella terrigena]